MDGVCCAASDDDCRQSNACKLLGACTSYLRVECQIKSDDYCRMIYKFRG